MKIIEPSVELWKQGDNVYDHVARCARVCYRSVPKDENSNFKFYTALQASGHRSMFRHQNIYAICPYTPELDNALLMYIKCPYIDYILQHDLYYISTNKHFKIDLLDYIALERDGLTLENRVLYENLNKYAVTEELFCNNNNDKIKELRRITFKVTTQISTSRELNRVSPNNIAEQSTRYVYDDGTLCRPHWIIKEDITFYKNNISGIDDNALIYLKSCEDQFEMYKTLVDNGLNKQDARGILPLDTATVCVYTYSIKEWRHIINLRYYGITGRPHPNAKIIAGMIREKLIEEGYEFKEL